MVFENRGKCAKVVGILVEVDLALAKVISAGVISLESDFALASLG